MKRLVGGGLLAVAGLVSGAAPANASDTFYTSEDEIATTMPGGLMAAAALSQAAYFDSNALLQTTRVKPLWGSITTPELIVTDKTPQADILSDTVLISNNFNQSTFNSNDVHSKLGFKDQIERWTVGLQGHFDSDTTRSSELSNFNNTRVVPVHHIGGTAIPSIVYNVLPTDRVTLSGNYTVSHYDGTAFSDYTVLSVTPSYAHDFDPQNTGIVTFQAERYRTTSGLSSRSDTVGPSVGWQAKFTPRLSGDASVGVQETRQTGASTTAPAWKLQYNFAGGLHFKGDQDTVSLQATRAQFPFGNGTEGLTTKFEIDATHALNQKLSIGGGGSYLESSYQANAAGNLETLGSGNVDLAYNITDEVQVSAVYQYVHETLVGVGSAPEKHVATLGLTYRPKAWTLAP